MHCALKDDKVKQFEYTSLVCPFIDNIEFVEKLFKFEWVTLKSNYESLDSEFKSPFVAWTV